jgi:MarR family transcriptional regulator, transcriptional regulator for hemolysin
MDMERSLKREFLFNVVDTARHLRHLIDRRAQQYGLTAAQLRVLARLRRNEGMVQANLAAELDMHPMSAGGLIDKLARSGLVERRKDDADRRINRVHLTVEGREVANRLDAFREMVARDVLDGFDEGAIAQALSTLKMLRARLAAEDEAKARGVSRREAQTVVPAP